MNSSEPGSESGAKESTGGVVCSILFILIGAICYYETTKMTDPDSYVFPRMVIAGLIGLSIIHIISAFLNRPLEIFDKVSDEELVSSKPRRIVLVAAMAASALLMPVIGFVLSGFSTFLVLMLLSQYDEWTKKTLLIHTIVAVVIVFGFNWAFSNLLHVPLPEGSLINFL